LEASQRGVSEEELEKEQEVQEKIASQVASLTGSLAKMSERSETLRLELAKLQETASPSKKDGEDLNEKRRQVVYETAKVGAVLETMQGQLGQKLKIARKNAEKSSLDLALVREIWRCAKDDVTECQAELDKCTSGIAEVSNVVALRGQFVEQKDLLVLIFRSLYQISSATSLKSRHRSYRHPSLPRPRNERPSTLRPRVLRSATTTKQISKVCIIQYSNNSKCRDSKNNLPSSSLFTHHS
jgi:hypothetical protein